MIESSHDQAAELHAAMLERLEALTTSDTWVQALKQASRFHQYSLGNLMLIGMQNPEATRVAGFQTWKGMGRHVRKGEKGIRILAPMTYRRKETDDDGNDQDVIGVRGFRSVAVFDVSQTDGADLVDDVAPERLTGEGPDGLYDALAEQVKGRGFELRSVSPDWLGSANGMTDTSSKIVSLRSDLSPAQSCKTLAHELAHIALGHGHDLNPRSVREVEAESVSYIVVRANGLEPEAYSLPYIAGWSDGKAEVVKATAEHVLTVAREILASLSGEQVAA